jgi:hypothetical protein
MLRKAFEDDGWEVPRILSALDACNDLYFDRISQIRMDVWSHRRVARWLATRPFACLFSPAKARLWR